MATDSLFAGTEVPTAPDASDGGQPYTLGTRFVALANCKATGARWRFPNTLPSGTVTAYLWRNSDQALLGSKAFSSPVAGAWNSVTFDSPIDIVDGIEYTVAIFTPDRYVATAFYPQPFSVGGLIQSLSASSGRYNEGASPAFPSGGFQETSYFADVLVSDAVGTTQVTSTLDLRWQVRSAVTSTLDARWQVRNLVTSTADFRWQVRQIVTSTLNLQWAVRNAVTGTLDTRWAVLTSVTGTADLRWAVGASYTTVTSTLDLRWQTRSQLTGTADLRWSVAEIVASSLDVRWAVKGVVTGTLDVRWAVSNQITASLDVRWQTRQRVTGTVELRWVVDGEVFVPKSDVRAYLSQRVRSRPTLAQIRAYL